MDGVSYSLNAKRWMVLLTISLMSCFCCLSLSAQTSLYSLAELKFSPDQPVSSAPVSVEATVKNCLVFNAGGIGGAPETKIIVNGSRIDIYKAGYIAGSPLCVHGEFSDTFNVSPLTAGKYTVSLYIVDEGEGYKRSFKVISKNMLVTNAFLNDEEINKVPIMNNFWLVVLTFLLLFFVIRKK